MGSQEKDMVNIRERLEELESSYKKLLEEHNKIKNILANHSKILNAQKDAIPKKINAGLESMFKIIGASTKGSVQ